MEEETFVKPKSIILDCFISSWNTWRLEAHAQQPDRNIMSNDPTHRDNLIKQLMIDNDI